MSGYTRRALDGTIRHQCPTCLCCDLSPEGSCLGEGVQRGHCRNPEAALAAARREGAEKTRAEIQLVRIRTALVALVPLDGSFGAADDCERLRRALAAARREGAESERKRLRTARDIAHREAFDGDPCQADDDQYAAGVSHALDWAAGDDTACAWLTGLLPAAEPGGKDGVK